MNKKKIGNYFENSIFTQPPQKAPSGPFTGLVLKSWDEILKL